jgi:hypothetical protein
MFAASANADEIACIAARYSAAGKYAGCEAKAAAKGFDEQAFLKCRQKYAATWTRLGKKYPGTSCVGARFVDNGLTITDNLTQLVWEKKTTAIGSGPNASDRHDVDNVYSWSAGGPAADGEAFTDFLDDLNSTGFAGQHDWRLPTLFELQTILATDAVPCGTAPCVADPLFSPTQSDAYWSSSAFHPNSTIAWFVNFNPGFTVNSLKAFPFYVRGVRADS